MKILSLSLSAAVLAAVSTSAAAWWAAPPTEEQQRAFAEQQQAMAEQYQAMIDQQAEAWQSMMESQQRQIQEWAERTGPGNGVAPFGWAGPGLPHPALGAPWLHDLPVPPHPQVPALGEFPEMPEHPAFGERPELPSFADYPHLPEMPEIPELNLPELPGLPDLGEYPSWTDTRADIAKRRAELDRYREAAKQQAEERRAALEQMTELRRLQSRLRPYRGGYGGMPAGFAPLQGSSDEAPAQQDESDRLPTDAPASAQIQ